MACKKVVMALSLVSVCMAQAFLLVHTTAMFSHVTSFYCTVFVVYWKVRREGQDAMNEC